MKSLVRIGVGAMLFHCALLVRSADQPAIHTLTPPKSSTKPGFHLLPPSDTGVLFTNLLSDAKAAENQIRLNGSGVALGDVNGDGLCDIYLCRLGRPNALYRNLGNWKFEDITAASGAGCEGQDSTGAALADVDGDDDLDLLVNGIGAGTRLFRNDGKGHFTEVLESGLTRKLGATSMALADIDGDGDLDLYITNYRTTTIRTTGFGTINSGGRRNFLPEDRERLEFTPEGKVLEHGEADILYRNDGNCHFTALSWTDGTFLDEDGKPLTKAPPDWGLSVMFRDIDGDGAPDLYVCNDFHSTDKIWINDRQGHFRALPRLALRHTSTFSMSVDFGDLNRDGKDDIFVADMASRDHARRLMQLAATDPYFPTIGKFDDRPQFDRNTLQLNRGDGTYADVACYAGLDASDWTWSAILLDVDLDGYEDLLCVTGHEFDTQDLDAGARIFSKGPWPRDKIPLKLLMYPKMAQARLAFRNGGNLKFEDKSKEWGFDQVGVGHGLALADLDQDGDLDVVVNNLNSGVGIYRNNSDAPRIAVRLKGSGQNTRGIGAKIKVLGGPVPQTQEMISGGRYLSCDASERVFAAGALTNKLTVEVTWRSGKQTVIKDVRPNSLCEVSELTSAVRNTESADTKREALFEEARNLLNHTHREQPFDDFARQPLLARKLSQLGPGVAWFDVDGDGWDDLMIGSGKGGDLAILRNERGQKFTPAAEPLLKVPATRDHAGILGFTSGKEKEILFGLANYEDADANAPAVRLLKFASNAAVNLSMGHLSSSGPLAVADTDGAGHWALFVGGRVIAAKYPQASSSLLFKRSGSDWILDQENTAKLSNLGLVTSAIWTDLDSDGLPELVLPCEWGPIRIYKMRDEILHDMTKDFGLDRYLGWWSGVGAGDFDGDGRIDLIVGNWGLNTTDHASPTAPLRIYHGDFDGNGTVDLIEAQLNVKTGKWAPVRDRDVLVRALPYLAERFSTYSAFNSATVDDLLGDKLPSAKFLEVNTLASMLFLNRGNHFEPVLLPQEAQFAPAFGVSVADFDGDGHEDVFLSQNFFDLHPKLPRHDAGRGLLLLGDGAGHFRALDGQESGISIYGEQRGCAAADYDKDGRTDLVVTQNGTETILLHNRAAKSGLTIRLLGPAHNPDAIGAGIRLIFQNKNGPIREVHAGSGYLSQDASAQVMGMPETANAVEVRWPGGKITRSRLGPNLSHVQISSDGLVKSRK